jgi:hypothetical protein
MPPTLSIAKSSLSTKCDAIYAFGEEEFKSFNDFAPLPGLRGFGCDGSGFHPTASTNDR